ncbi:MAG: thioredoxin family protein [Candidatus Atribacteria bacterium]|nr:thioredoxin family protein [bacterium]MCG2762431.1 thioredoxin family protein [Candidatus Atribacteria bacterium]
MRIKIFWQKNCPHCPEAKKLGKKLENETEVQYFDIDTAYGLAEASYYDIASTPSIIVLDNNDNEIKIWRGKAPHLEEIREEAAI